MKKSVRKTNPLLSFRSWAAFCKKNKVTLPAAVLYYLKEFNKTTEDEIKKSIQSFHSTWKNLYKKIKNEKFTTQSGLITGVGPRLLEISEIDGFIYNAAVASAIMEATASGSIPVVPAFTCGAAGTVPAILYDLLTDETITTNELVEMFLICFGVGVISKTISSIAGAIGMCSAETGNSSAAAAAAKVWHYTKSAEKTFKVVELVINQTQGVPCDPTCGGLVEVPCIARNGITTIIALNNVDAVLNNATIESSEPDQALRNQKKIADAAPITLKETSLGGTAVTPGAIKYYNEKVKNKIPDELKNIIVN